MSKDNNLFNEFNSVTLTEWVNKIEKDLKGKPLSSLTWNSQEGIDINPYFNKENSLNYGDGSLSKKGIDNNWFINHIIEINEDEQANKEALKALEGGVNSITFKGDLNNIDILLKDILIDIIALNFVTTKPKEVIEKLTNYCAKNNLSKANINGSISYNYINEKDKLGNNIELTQNFNFKNIVLHNEETINAGANITEQLAVLIAEGNEYLKNGYTTPSQYQFNVSLGGNYFFEIAKIRALRILWSNILNAYNTNDTSTTIHCNTSTLLWSKTDNENNILRASSTAMSAVIGGCDSLTITPHDMKNSDFSNRVAKNIQLLLKEESYLDKVKDPANGSYYIEHLTKILAQNAWTLFQEIEANGGYLKAMDSGFIPELVTKSGDKLIESFNNGEITIIGLTKYNQGDTKVSLTKENEANKVFNKLVLKEI